VEKLVELSVGLPQPLVAGLC